jgi:hypothetical protein
VAVTPADGLRVFDPDQDGAFRGLRVLQVGYHRLLAGRGNVQRPQTLRSYGPAGLDDLTLELKLLQMT